MTAAELRDAHAVLRHLVDAYDEGVEVLFKPRDCWAALETIANAATLLGSHVLVPRETVKQAIVAGDAMASRFRGFGPIMLQHHRDSIGAWVDAAAELRACLGPVDEQEPNQTQPKWGGELTCDYCGWLDWTVKKLGRVTHKHACPVRTDAFCQSHPKGCRRESGAGDEQ